MSPTNQDGNEIHWGLFFDAHGDDEIKAFGWPEERSRNIGTVENLYQMFKRRWQCEAGGHEFEAATDFDDPECIHCGEPSGELARDPV